MFFIRFFIKCFLLLFLCTCFFLQYVKADQGGNYLSSDFCKIETLCKEVINDFTVMKFDSAVNITWIRQSSYITDQLIALQEAISNLVENEEEVRIYLTEDYAYLLDLFLSVEQQFKKWRKKYATKSHNAVAVCLQRIVEQSKKNLQRIVEYNKEVIVSDDFLCRFH